MSCDAFRQSGSAISCSCSCPGYLTSATMAHLHHENQSYALTQLSVNAKHMAAHAIKLLARTLKITDDL